MHCSVRTLLPAFLLLSVTLPSPTSAQSDDGRWGRVSVIQMPFTGARNVPEISDNPAYIFDNGVMDTIRSMGFVMTPDRTVGLTAAEDREYALGLFFQCQPIAGMAERTGFGERALVY